MSDNKASVNKDDLLSMVRYGAEMVFSGGGGTITDEDIDAIIAKVTSRSTVVSAACCLHGVCCWRSKHVTSEETSLKGNTLSMLMSVFTSMHWLAAQSSVHLSLENCRDGHQSHHP